jgi:hypothetical protein
MQKHNLQKHSSKETKILQNTITLQLISSFNTSQNITFQKSSYKNRPITKEQKSIKLLYSIMNLNTISLPTNKLALPLERIATEGKEHALRKPHDDTRS